MLAAKATIFLSAMPVCRRALHLLILFCNVFYKHTSTHYSKEQRSSLVQAYDIAHSRDRASKLQRISKDHGFLPTYSKHLQTSPNRSRRAEGRLFRLCYGSMDALRCHGHPKLAFPKSLVSQADDTKTAQPPDGI